MALFKKKQKPAPQEERIEQIPDTLHDLPDSLRQRIQAQKDEYQKQSEALRQQTETIIHLLVDGYVSGLNIFRGSKIELDYDALVLKITPPDAQPA